MAVKPSCLSFASLIVPALIARECLICFIKAASPAIFISISFHFPFPRIRLLIGPWLDKWYANHFCHSRLALFDVKGFSSSCPATIDFSLYFSMMAHQIVILSLQGFIFQWSFSRRNGKMRIGRWWCLKLNLYPQPPAELVICQKLGQIYAMFCFFFFSFILQKLCILLYTPIWQYIYDSQMFWIKVSAVWINVILCVFSWERHFIFDVISILKSFSGMQYSSLDPHTSDKWCS